MNKTENDNFFVGCLFGGIAVFVIFLFVLLIRNSISVKIEDTKTEKLTIIYKNTNSNIDKDLAVNIAKHYFPTSNWTNVENKANKNSIEFNVWTTEKK